MATIGTTIQPTSLLARIGARQSGINTPASIAWASDFGIRAMMSPSCGQSPVATIAIPTMTNAPIAAGKPPLTAAVLARSAAPGVDQAQVIGIRYRRLNQIQAIPMATDRMSSPEAACRSEAPTDVSPASTTTNEDVNPTRAVTMPALIGSDRFAV
ncbi:MAG: hypothetical protein WKF81_01100 [Thermomicrobiales bacterium]